MEGSEMGEKITFLKQTLIVPTVKNSFIFKEMLFDIFALWEKESVFISTFTGTIFP